jgi:light-regulated signal transduction histidine kinase (bacteriophytochrome)
MFSIEKRYVRKDGSLVWVNVTVSLVREPLSEPKYFIGVAEDISQRKRAESEILYLNADLEQRVAERTAELTAVNKELEAFAYSVSHDLRAPLRHIDGFIGLLREQAGSALDSQAHRYLDIIGEAAQKMGALIDDLLAFSRMGRAELVRRPINMEQLVKDVLQEVEREARERPIDWCIDALPEVEADPAMLRIVLMNLLNNAIKFTGQREQPRVEVGYLMDQPGEVVFFVRDNGAGFDRRYADKLFGVFQRLHRADEFEGTGIGLANVRRIVHRHGGQVWAEGQVDAGATFYFSLPVPPQRG